MKNICYSVLAVFALLSLNCCQDLESPLNTVPNITTDAVEELYDRGAVLFGEISSKGECYFLVSTSEDMSDARMIEAYSEKHDEETWLCFAEVGDLQPGTTYYAVLCATDGRSEVKGNIVSFTTSSYLEIESVFKANGEPYTDDILGVYLANANQHVFSKYGNMRALRNGWAGDGQPQSYDLPYNFVVTESTTVYAYAPYTTKANDETLDQIYVLADGHTDYQYGSCIISKENPKANIKMKSAMAELLIRMTVDGGSWRDVFDVLTVNLRNTEKGNMSFNGTLDLTTGNIDPDFVEGHDGAFVDVDKRVSKGEDYVEVEMFVVPTEFEDGDLEFVVSTKDGYHMTIPVSAAKWEKGQTYEMPLVLNVPRDNRLGIESVFDAYGKPYTGDILGVYLANANQHVFENYGNQIVSVKWTEGGNSQRFDLDFMVTEPTTVYAYIPWDEKSNPDVLNQVLVRSSVDYQYGSCTVTSENPTGNIKMLSAMAHLQFVLSSGSEMSQNVEIRDIRLQNVNKETTDECLSIQGMLDLTTGTITPTPIKGHDGIGVKINSYFSDTRPNITAGMYVIPTSFADGGLTLTINTSAGEVEVPIPGATWEKGKTYEIPVTVNSEPVQNVPGEAVYMGFNGDDGKPLYWASWNLGASSPEDYGGLYGWADPTGEKKSTNLNDYPNDNPPADISGTEYDLARKMWGGAWRIPSVNEMWGLLAYSTEEWTTVNGVQGVKYTSEKNGNTIFFPVAPHRIGTSVSTSSSTYYWLSTLDKDNSRLANTYYIYYGYSLLAYPTAGQERYYGLPIRPVTSQP